MLRPVYFTWIGIWHGHQSHNGKISFLDSREPLADLFLPWGAADPQEPFKFMSFSENNQPTPTSVMISSAVSHSSSSSAAPIGMPRLVEASEAALAELAVQNTNRPRSP